MMAHARSIADKWLRHGPPPFVPLLGPRGDGRLSRSARRGQLITLPDRTKVGLTDGQLLNYNDRWCFVQPLDATPLTCMATTGYGHGVALGGADGALRLLNLWTGTFLRLGAAGGSPVEHIVALGNNAYVCALQDGTLHVYDLRVPTLVLPPRDADAPKITGLEQLAEDRVIVRCEGGTDHELYL
jgi:hypothetical protein